MYTLHRFQKLPAERQIDQLGLHGTELNLVYCTESAEAVLYAYHDFYVELLLARHTDEIIEINCFRSSRKLEPYLPLIDITEITALLHMAS